MELAIEKSKSMGIPLFSQDVGKGEALTGNIVSLGSPAPYEYVDSSKGLRENGIYSITNFHRLN